jgi:hypothetical protein
MKFLDLDCKTGFWNTGNQPIVILDDTHRPFYDTSILENRVIQFNLPAGEYYVFSGKFQQMMSPVNYPLIPLPLKEKHLQNPEHFAINYANNQHTASIHWDENRIILDKSLRSLTLPELFFILYHEYGHRFYNNEKACDAYATNRMLKEGYNPSQIGVSIINTLSDKNVARKEKLIESLEFVRI